MKPYYKPYKTFRKELDVFGSKAKMLRNCSCYYCNKKATNFVHFGTYIKSLCDAHTQYEIDQITYDD